MAFVERIPYAGPLSIDLTPRKDIIFDLPHGALLRLKGEKEGIEGVIEELNVALTAHASVLGLAPDMLNRINKHTSNINDLRSDLSKAEKIVEVLKESLALEVNDREAEIGTVVESVRKGAKKVGPSIEPPFERTVKYHGQIALKAASTRKKNATAAEAAAEAAADAAAAEATGEAAEEKPGGTK